MNVIVRFVVLVYVFEQQGPETNYDENEKEVISRGGGGEEEVGLSERMAW